MRLLLKKNLTTLIPISILAVVFLVYFFTKPPSILWIDSGTMIAASASLGIPNPPGFPFYMLASHLFTKIISVIYPFSKLFSLELFTIVFSLCLLFCVYKIILLVLQNKFFFHKPGKHQTVQGNSLLPHLSAAFGTIALAFSYQYWSQSQNTEAFIFSYFFVALFAYLLLKLMVKKADVFKTLLLIAFLYGLAAGANPTTAALVPATLYVMFLSRKSLTIPKLIVLGATFTITISLVYSYLPIRASSWPFVNWGNPQTPELFIGHLKGHGLDIYEPEGGSINGFTGSPLVFFQSASYFLLNSLIQFTPLLVPFYAAGMYLVFRSNKYLFVFLMSVPFLDVIYSGVYFSGNQESWFILSWMFFAVFAGLGFNFAASRLKKLTNMKLVLLLTFCLTPLIAFFTILNRSGHHYSSDYIYNLYAPLEKNAIIIGTGDFFNSLSHYTHEADIFRPDVTPITANVMYVNRWSRDGLRRATNLSISDRIEEIIQYKKYSEYNDAMNQFIDENIKTRPIYVTHLTLRASALAATNGGQLKLDERFKFVPHGLTLKVVYATNSAEPDTGLYNFRFTSPLDQTPYYFERNYRGGFTNIINDYVYAYEYLADWFAEKGQDQNALEYYRKAVELSQGKNAEVLAHLGEFYARRSDFNSAYQYFAKSERLDVKNIGVHFNLGLVYMNLGRMNDAIQEFESVKKLSPQGDPIFDEAENMIKKLNALNLDDPKFKELTAGWEEIQDDKNNFSIKLPKSFGRENVATSSTVLISDKNPGSFGLNIEIFGDKLTEGETIEQHIEKSPLAMIGILLDIQQVNIPGFVAAVQVFGTPGGDSSQRFILIKEGWVWQLKVYPGNSVKLPLLYQILSTFKQFKK